MLALTFVLSLVLLFVTLFFSSFYLLPNSYTSSSSYVILILNSMNKTFYSGLFTTLLLTLLLINVAGNIPGFSIPTLFYYFSGSLSITAWVALFIVITATQMKSFMAHMLPFGAPAGLMLILPLIELFSQVIRPLTLMIRLSTNLSSGHIMMYMFSFFSVSSVFLTISLSLVLSAMFLLELMISILQAYIFSSLVLMYISETL